MDPFRDRIEQALVGQYRFVRELGGGGMSRTYLADEPALQRRVVVKVLAPEELFMLEQLPYRAAAGKRLAELLDAKGDAAGAITHYEQFAALRKDAEPSRQPVVKAARERATQLRAAKNPG